MRLYNTLGRRLEDFEPMEPGRVGLYVCGITVYDDLHVGHARALVVYDVLYRHLLARGLDVTFVRNITDVDDKIIARAAREGVPPDEVTATYVRRMHEDARMLGTLPPTHEPRATDSIEAMVRLIGTLIDNGHAYAPGNGDVYYSVVAFDGYGKLSGQRPDELRAGARVAVDEVKRDALDFALWKAARPGEPAWPSPWGDGRPGWHIECSAMAKALLGERFDIHGGGLDLVFPHHENEIAQSEAAHGCGPARVWLHNGLVTVDGEKMSKSVGNFTTLRRALERHSGEELRAFIVASHYRSPLNHAADSLDAARAGLRRLYTALRGVPVDGGDVPVDGAAVRGSRDGERDEAAVAAFETAMDDDLNTPEAMAVLHALAGRLNVAKAAADKAGGDDAGGSGDAGGTGDAARIARTLRELGARLGLLQDDPEGVLQGGGRGASRDGSDARTVEALIAERAAARAAKDFARADAVRDELVRLGIVLEDAGGATRWRRA